MLKLIRLTIADFGFRRKMSEARRGKGLDFTEKLKASFQSRAIEYDGEYGFEAQASNVPGV